MNFNKVIQAIKKLDVVVQELIKLGLDVVTLLGVAEMLLGLN